MTTSTTAIFFFFSSRRRHTIFDCDWSSDVCSSDLQSLRGGPQFVDHREDFARERADLVLDDGRRLQRQTPGGFVGRAEHSRKRLELSQRRAEHFRGGRELANGRTGLVDRSWEQLQRALEARVLLGER